MTSLLVGIAAMGCTLLALQGYRMLRAPRLQTLGYLELIEQSSGPSGRRSLLGRLLGFLDRVVGGRVLGQLTSASRTRLREGIVRAGSPDGVTVESLVQRQATWALIGLLAAGVLLLRGSYLGLLLPVAGWFLPRFALWSSSRRRAATIERSLPDFLDVLAVTISAGLGFRPALRRVATLVDGVVSEEMLIALRQIDLGASRRTAFEEMRDRTTAPSLHNFVTAFLQAEELGTPLSGFLETYATELRRTAGQRARTAAARANPKISVILTLVIMPAISIFMIGSLVLMAFVKV
jgi:tight adherence protein C